MCLASSKNLKSKRNRKPLQESKLSRLQSPLKKFLMTVKMKSRKNQTRKFRLKRRSLTSLKRD